MSTYPPEHQPWHDDVAATQDCDCDMAYKGRGLVDTHCWYHQAIETVEVLRERGWVVQVESVLPSWCDPLTDKWVQSDELAVRVTQLGRHMSDEMADAIGRQRERYMASLMVDRRGWSDKQWIADARRLMNEPDGAITSLLNGHVMALLRAVEEVDDE